MIDTLIFYKYFLAVVEEGSVTAAAKKLYISQPAVSSALTKLEQSLGTVLFSRKNRTLTLTAEGQLLYEHVSRAMAFLETGENKLREIADLSGGTLHIGASDMTLKFFLLDKIEKFISLHDAVHLQINNHPTPETLTLLSQGKIDLAAVSAPIPADEDMVVMPVRKIRDIFVCAPDYPVGERITVEELTNQRIILLEKGTSSRAYVEDCLFSGKEHFTPDIELATSELLLEFAARKLGIACVVEDFALPYLESGRLRRLEIDQEIPPRDLLLVHLKKIPQSAATRAFLALATEN